MTMPRLALITLSVVALAGCASRSAPPPPVYGGPVYGQPQPAAQSVYGRVTRIETTSSREEVSGAGAAAGGVAGAVIGRQIASDRDGKAMGTFIGAVVGAFIGHQIEKDRADTKDVLRVTVALDGGGSRSFDYRDAGGLRVGDRVRIEGDKVFRL